MGLCSALAQITLAYSWNAKMKGIAHQQLSLQGVPEVDLAIQRGRGQHLAAGRPCQGQDIMRVLEHLNPTLATAPHIPPLGSQLQT